MNIIARKALREFWEKHAQAETPMKLLYSRLESRDWEGPQDIKDEFGTSVDFVGDNRVIFDVSGNKFRVIIAFAYEYKRGLIKFVGTHSEYDKINAETI